MPTRVMLVDDAVVVRHVLTDALAKDSDLLVVGTASNGQQAIDTLERFNPDVVVLDVEMPVMDGIETLGIIKKRWPRVKVIMFSTLTSRGAAATMDALMMGADDYVCKPANVQSVEEALMRVNSDLLPRIKALHKAMQPTTPVAANPSATAFNPATSFSTPKPVAPTPATATPVATSAPVAEFRPRATLGVARPRILAIAVSTGGPNALASFLPQLPGDLAVPVVIVQHIPPMFSKALADRLDTKSPLNIAECQPGAILQAGDVWIAPGDFHMTVKREGPLMKLETNQGPPENSCRPSADVLFRSVAQAYGADVLGLVLTGMGNDGLRGSQTLVAGGAKVIVQDEATSIVWGMPGAVANAGIADRILPLQSIAAEVVARVGTKARVDAGIRTSHP